MPRVPEPSESHTHRRVVRQPLPRDDVVGRDGSRPEVQDVHGDQVGVDTIQPADSGSDTIAIQLDPGGIWLLELHQAGAESVEELGQGLFLDTLTLLLDIVSILATGHEIPVPSNYR